MVRVDAAFEVSQSFMMKPFLSIQAGGTFIFRSLSCFFDMFVDLTKLLLSALSLNCRNACVIGIVGHLIWMRSIGISMVSMISLSMSGTSCSVVSSWNPVTAAVFLFWFSYELFPSVSFVLVPLPLLFGSSNMIIKRVRENKKTSMNPTKR